MMSKGVVVHQDHLRETGRFRFSPNTTEIETVANRSTDCGMWTVPPPHVRMKHRQTPPPPKVDKPGIYILQAGSFSRLADANRRKAEIALLGVHAEIKKGNANGRAVYRVYTDPMEQPAEVNRVSKLLTDSGIEILRKRVSD